MMDAMGLFAAQAGGDAGGLTVGGVVMMTVSVGFVLVLTVFCLIRILREPAPETHHHALLDIDTKDLDT
ncbi:MAG: hypothetical protein ACE5E6_06220 [Phycisphaerae bacterium]